MNIILDIIVVAIIAFCAFLAAKKGFVRSLIELIGYILALVIAVNLGGWFANYFYDNSISPTVLETLAAALSSGVSDISENLPDFFVSLAGLANVDFAVIGNETVDVAALRIVDAIRPVAVSIIKCLAVFIISVVLIIVFKFLAKIINSLFKGAVLGGVNGLLGAVIGAAKGLVFSILACVLLSFLINTSGGDFFGITVDTVESTTICKMLLNLVSGVL